MGLNMADITKKIVSFILVFILLVSTASAYSIYKLSANKINDGAKIVKAADTYSIPKYSVSPNSGIASEQNRQPAKIYAFKPNYIPSDPDEDGVYPDDEDNCPDIYNPDQTDTDKNGIGDACEPKSNGKKPQSSGNGLMISVLEPKPYSLISAKDVILKFIIYNTNDYFDENKESRCFAEYTLVGPSAESLASYGALTSETVSAQESRSVSNRITLKNLQVGEYYSVIKCRDNYGYEAVSEGIIFFKVPAEQENSGSHDDEEIFSDYTFNYNQNNGITYTDLSKRSKLIENTASFLPDLIVQSIEADPYQGGEYIFNAGPETSEAVTLTKITTEFRLFRVSLTLIFIQ